MSSIECKEHLLVSFLVREGFNVYPINPKSAERYKDRYNVGGTKTDPVDAFSLADILRTDRHKHRPLAYSSEEVRKLQLLCMEYDKLHVRSFSGVSFCLGYELFHLPFGI